MRWINGSLKVKLATAFAAVSAVFLVAVAVGFGGLSSVGTSVERGFNKALLANQASAYAFNMRVSQVQDALAGKFILNPDGSVMHRGDMAAFAASVKRLHGLATTDYDRRSLSRVDALFAAWKQGDDRSAALWRSASRKASTAFELGQENDRGDALSTALFDYANGAEKAARAAKAHSVSSAQRLMGGLSLVALLIAFAVVFLVTRSIARRVQALRGRLDSLNDRCLSDLTEGLKAAADGDLTVEVHSVTAPLEVDSRDELGRLAETFNAMLAKAQASTEAYGAMRTQLGELIATVSETAGTVSAASQQMASTSDEAGRAVGEIASAVGDVAQGAERQVRMVEATRSAVQEAARAAGDSAQTASATAGAALQAREAAREGVGAAGEATAAIRLLAESSAQVASSIEDLSSRSERIGGIVTTITGIAEQTNLLALNAAIEAARAGEQGRGFAVVAEEVRKLAEESQDAAGQIAGLIAEIQAQTGAVVGVVSQSARRTEEGVATVERTRQAFERIDSAVEDVTARIGEISSAVEQIAAEAARAESDIAEVASVAEQSSASAEQVSASTQQTSASTQEISSSANELAQSAEQLNQLVSRFRVSA
jgi:methyl-accepting chemotaxis protein